MTINTNEFGVNTYGFSPRNIFLYLGQWTILHTKIEELEVNSITH